MDSRKVVMRETAAMAVGEILLSAAMVGVFAALGYFKMNVLWGALLGCLVMIVNHLFLAITVTMATDRAAKGNVQQAQKMIQLSSSTRLVLLGVVLVVCLKLGANPLALLLPLLFARPILMLWELFGKKEDK